MSVVTTIFTGKSYRRLLFRFDIESTIDDHDPIQTVLEVYSDGTSQLAFVLENGELAPAEPRLSRESARVMAMQLQDFCEEGCTRQQRKFCRWGRIIDRLVGPPDPLRDHCCDLPMN